MDQKSAGGTEFRSFLKMSVALTLSLFSLKAIVMHKTTDHKKCEAGIIQRGDFVTNYQADYNDYNGPDPHQGMSPCRPLIGHVSCFWPLIR